MSHTFANVLVHVIFSTKNRAPMIRKPVQERLYEYLGGVARHEFGQALRIGGTENHVHGLLVLRTDIALSQAMSKWKSLSSGWVHTTFPEYGAFAWQGGYGAFSVSESNAATVVAYIDRQAEHHQTMSFEEEFAAFLERHGVKYDPAHLWD